MAMSIVWSNQFKKDYKKAAKRGLDLSKLESVISALANNEKLSPEHKDYQLAGNYSKFRECHIEPDWLLVYAVDNNELQLYLFRTGTHSDLF